MIYLKIKVTTLIRKKILTDLHGKPIKRLTDFFIIFLSDL